MENKTRRVQWHNALYWLLLFNVLWYLLTGGTGWELGMPSAILATGLALKLQVPPARMRLLRLPGFIVFFVGATFSGAWDVARRTLHPHCPLNPAWVTFELNSTTPEPVRLLCSAMVGLLPGTLASHLDQHQMQLHVLDEQQSWRSTVAELEQRLNRLLITRGQR